MNDALLRRVSDALDAPGGLDADEELRALLEGDPSAQAYADDVGAIGEALSALGASLDVDRDWDALASAIDLRLAESKNVDDDGLDVTAPPRLTGPSGPESAESGPSETGPSETGPSETGPSETGPSETGPTLKSSESGASRSRPSEAQASFEPAPAVRTVSPARASAAPETSSRVVDLSERRRRRGLFAAIGGLSAAAAVGLGITFGLTTMSDPAAELAAAPAAEASQPDEAEMAAPAAAPGVWAGAERMVAEAEESEPELPAAAALNQWGSESSLGAREGGGLPQGTGGGSAQAMRRQERGAVARSITTAPSAESRLPSRPAPAASPSEPPPSSYAATEPEPASAAVGALARSTRPSTGETDAALSAVTRAVQRCMPDHTVVARVAVTVRGGAITAVRIPAPFAGHSSGACMERAVRAVRMPASVEAYEAEFVYRPAPVAGSGPGPSAAPSSRARRAAPVRSHEVLDAFESAPR